MSISRDIWREHRAIVAARTEKMREAMEAYDRDVYRPAMKSLIERCEAIGHVRGYFHNNGLGWCWYVCNQCGARMEIEGPPDSESQIGADSEGG